jgi:hypothetical protein
MRGGEKMTVKKHRPEPRSKKSKEVPANAKLDSLELEQGARSYQIYAYFEGPDGGGIDFELKIGRQADLGKEIAAVIEKMKAHPNRKVS